jgi:hypothetical protein
VSDEKETPHDFVFLGTSLPGVYVDRDSGDVLQALGPLSRINLFIGPTNAGKSRLLRHILKTR